MKMLRFNKLVISNDLAKFSKDNLKEIATELDIISNNNKMELAINVFNGLKDNKNVEENEKIQKIIGENLLVGKTSIKWYTLNTRQNFESIKQNIVNNSNFDILNKISIPEPNDLNTDPHIFGAYIDDSTKELYLRVIYKSGVKSDMYGDEVTTRPVPGFSTIYIDFNKKLIEYRGDYKKANSTIEQLLFLTNLNTDDDSVRENFDFTIDEIADKLNGALYDTLSSTEIETNLEDEELEGITQVLIGLDSYFKDSNIENLEAALVNVNDILNGSIDDLVMPFSSLLLSGLNTVGLSGDSEIRNSPLFSYLKPNLRQTSGFIKFNLDENGIEKLYTLRVGLQTKSIYFNTPVNESVLKEVREKLLYNN